MQDESTVASDWNLERIPLASIEPVCIKDQEELFYMVTAASFIESGADLYTDNLVRYFSGDGEVSDWLSKRWQVEEMRHGRALRDYVCHVWPEFDWERAYSAFHAEYSQQCTVDEFEPTRGLEMVARCVVETGTAAFYQALAAQAVEPVLAGIANRIRADEIGHYKYFYRYFRKYGSKEASGRLRIMAALARRMFEARRGDGECALWHAYVVRSSVKNLDRAGFRALSRRLSYRLRSHFPTRMAVRMLLKPLGLPASVANVVEAPLARIVGWALH